jgi:hypothetical protein
VANLLRRADIRRSPVDATTLLASYVLSSAAELRLDASGAADFVRTKMRSPLLSSLSSLAAVRKFLHVFLSRPAMTAGAALLSVLFVTRAASAIEDREPPDYAGRDQRTSVGDVAIWVPRIVLSPLYFVSEFVIRRPLGAGLSLAERKHVPEALYDFFTLTPDHKVGIVPTFLVDFGFKPSVGLYFFWDDFLAKDNDLRIHAATWGPTWLAAGVTDRVRLDKIHTLAFDVSGIRRPDYRYYGEGPSSLKSNYSRYGSSRVQGGVTFASKLGETNALSVGAGVRKVSFHEPLGIYTPTTELIDNGIFPAPTAFDTGYTSEYNQVELVLDSRQPHAREGSGVRLEAGAEQGSTLNSPPRNWIRYGANVTGFLDVNGRGRVLGLTLTTLFSDPLTDRLPPFTELVQLGGASAMPGFLPGRLIGRSAAAATISYHWPIWVWLDGTIQAAVGNVFDEHLEDFRAPLFRFSTAIGIETAGVTDNPVQILFGVGTETFESGAKLDSLRLVFGSPHAF